MKKINGDIDNNPKYKKMMDRYLASAEFSDKCKELKALIQKSEKERKEKERIKSMELKLFN